MITIHENKADYTAAEAAILKQTYDALEVKAQGGDLTIDETRIRVAYIRYQREDNFKIVVEKKTAPKTPKEPKGRKAKITKPKAAKNNDIAQAQELWAKQLCGGTLTEEEQAFVNKMLPPPDDL